ncbi:hypothetical protein ABTM69_19730, partial [Acinetobacter baumannii]
MQPDRYNPEKKVATQRATLSNSFRVFYQHSVIVSVTVLFAVLRLLHVRELDLLRLRLKRPHNLAE